MNTEKFWKIIDESCKESAGDNEAFLDIANGKAAALEAAEKIEFRSCLGVYTEIASECVWLNMACKVINGYVSDDTGLYFGLWIIALGKDVFLNALKNPDSLAELANIPFGNAEFEMLMAVGYEEDETAYADETLQEKAAVLAEVIRKETEFKGGGMYGDYENFDWKNYI